MENNPTINPLANTGFTIKINDRISPNIASANNHPQPLILLRCNSTAAPIPHIDWNITQKPTKKISTKMLSNGIARSKKPNNKSITPLANVHPQPLIVSLLDTAKMISAIPLTKKLAVKSADKTINVLLGAAAHHIPNITASIPTNNDTHQYLTACFTELKISFFILIKFKIVLFCIVLILYNKCTYLILNVTILNIFLFNYNVLLLSSPYDFLLF